MTSPTHRAECSAAALYVGIELSLREWLLTLGAVRRPGGCGCGSARGIGRPWLTRLRGRRRGSACPRRRRCGVVTRRGATGFGRTGSWRRSASTIWWSTRRVSRCRGAAGGRRRIGSMGRSCCTSLLRHWGGERQMWQVVPVPAPAREDARHASRSLTTLQRERTRCRNRIHGLLALHGVRLRVDAQLPARLAAARDWAGGRCRPGCRRGCSRRGGSGQPWRRSGGRSAPPRSSGCGRPRRRSSRWRSA